MFEHTLIGIMLVLITTLPLAWKWQLGMRRIALLVILLALLSGLIVTFLENLISINVLTRAGLVWLMTLAATFAFLAYRFYRDPERTISNRNDVIVSPADGKVIYIRESHGGLLPVSTKYSQVYPLQELTKSPFYSQEAVVIGISMNLVVVQIASRLVRQIATFVREGQGVELGQRIGAIRFGSQVDLVLPICQDLKIRVQPGELVKAGQSIIATFEPMGASMGETQERSG